MSAYTNLREIDSETSSVNYMDVGIHENVELKRIVFDKSPNGNQFIAFYFEDEDAKVLSHTEWEPQDKDPVKLENKTVNQIKRLKHIATKYVTKEVFDTINANDFRSFCDGIIKVLGNKYVGEKMRVKVTYNWNNYTSFPNYTPFIESMAVTKTKLTIGSNDKMTKDVADRETVIVNNPFEPSAVTTTQDVTNDLPF